MAITTIIRENCFDAWTAAARHLIARPGCEDDNLIIEIENPTIFDASWFKKIDPSQTHESGDDPSDVANTIFPLQTWVNAKSRSKLYDRYVRAHRMGSRKSWGTYFLRLIQFGASETNQLERAIGVLNNWKKEPGTAIVFHLSSAEIDRPRPLGAPCLQLCQLHARAGKIHMTAVYRNHDYFNKSMPNFVGLGRLLDFICVQTQHRPGRLVCHSVHAYSSSGKAALGQLFARA